MRKPAAGAGLKEHELSWTAEFAESHLTLWRAERTIFVLARHYTCIAAQAAVIFQAFEH